jgi:iron(III) transport system ATP-binding protein
MPAIELSHIDKAFHLGRQRVKAVEAFSLTIPEGKIVTLLGPSGCGKSTTLRCIAGLERPDDGEIRFGERVVFSRRQRVFIPPERRNIGMVFQSYAIWPHLTVFENVAYPLQVRKVSGGEVRDRVRRALDLVGLAGLEDRPAPFLSGGQQQRVALARALVYEPSVLLLDEPLSNLDAKVREHVREDLRILQRQLGITTVYVTHDQLEALSLSDVVAVMHDGHLVEVGTPQALYERPRARFTSDFLGEISYLAGTVASKDGSSLTVLTAYGPVRCVTALEVRTGDAVLAGIRPEHVTLSTQRPGDGTNAFEGTVVSVLFEGTHTKYRVSVGDLAFLAFGRPAFSVGDRVIATVDPDRLVVLREIPATEAAPHS